MEVKPLYRVRLAKVNERELKFSVETLRVSKETKGAIHAQLPYEDGTGIEETVRVFKRDLNIPDTSFRTDILNIIVYTGYTLEEAQIKGLKREMYKRVKTRAHKIRKQLQEVDAGLSNLWEEVE